MDTLAISSRSILMHRAPPLRSFRVRTMWFAASITLHFMVIANIKSIAYLNDSALRKRSSTFTIVHTQVLVRLPSPRNVLSQPSSLSDTTLVVVASRRAMVNRLPIMDVIDPRLFTGGFAKVFGNKSTLYPCWRGHPEA